MRKQRRQAELQDKRDRIRMGLIPPDPPKGLSFPSFRFHVSCIDKILHLVVRLANLMKVLTSDAVQDPTRVEARVRREVAMRKHTHEKMNAERKLTDEQRKEKVENKKLDEEKKGIYGAVFKYVHVHIHIELSILQDAHQFCVYLHSFHTWHDTLIHRIKTLSDPSHRFKVRKNAEQRNLTGVCIYNPGFSMVYVEGAAKFIRQYKHLMMDRIAWTEPARQRGNSDVEIDEGDDSDNDEGGGGTNGDKGKEKAVPRAEDDHEAPVSLEDNQCWLIWEGQLRDRAYNNFKPKSCPTDGAAKEVLGMKLAGYWDQAKNWKPEEEELF